MNNNKQLKKDIADVFLNNYGSTVPRTKVINILNRIVDLTNPISSKITSLTGKDSLENLSVNERIEETATLRTIIEPGTAISIKLNNIIQTYELREGKKNTALPLVIKAKNSNSHWALLGNYFVYRKKISMHDIVELHKRPLVIMDQQDEFLHIEKMIIHSKNGAIPYVYNKIAKLMITTNQKIVFETSINNIFDPKTEETTHIMAKKKDYITKSELTMSTDMELTTGNGEMIIDICFTRH